MNRRHLIAVALAAFVGFIGTASAQDMTDESTNRQVQAIILDQLSPYALRRNGLFYTQFEIAGQQPPPQEGGFAPPLTPRGAPLVQNGIMEITPSSWSFGLLRNADGGASGVVTLRIFRYRIFQPDRGWSAPNLLMLHFWEWSVRIDANGPQVSAKMDETAYPTDNGPRELVASVFNVPPQGVSVVAPQPYVVDQILAGGTGSQQSSGPNGGCRPCETQQPDGSCVQFRACY